MAQMNFISHCENGDFCTVKFAKNFCSNRKLNCFQPLGMLHEVVLPNFSILQS